MAFQMVATAVTLNDLEGHSPLADVFKCNLLNICVALYMISTNSVLTWFLCISRASCLTPTVVGGWRPLSSETCTHIDSPACKNTDFDRFLLITSQP